MGIRTRLDSLLGDKLTPVRDLIRDQIREKLPEGLKSLGLNSQSLNSILQNPRRLGGLVEERSPWLNRHVLGAASNIAEPFLAGMGLSVSELAEESIVISMPGWWRNQGEQGAIHMGALCTLGEFTSRLYWEHHLDLRRSEMVLSGMQVRPVGGSHKSGLNHLRGSMQARYHISTAEREAVLHRLRASGSVELNCEVSVFDEGKKLIAEVQLEWRFVRQLSLGANSETNSQNESKRSTEGQKDA